MLPPSWDYSNNLFSNACNDNLQYSSSSSCSSSSFSSSFHDPIFNSPTFNTSHQQFLSSTCSSSPTLLIWPPPFEPTEELHTEHNPFRQHASREFTVGNEFYLSPMATIPDALRQAPGDILESQWASDSEQFIDGAMRSEDFNSPIGRREGEIVQQSIMTPQSAITEKSQSRPSAEVNDREEHAERLRTLHSDVGIQDMQCWSQSTHSDQQANGNDRQPLMQLDNPASRNDVSVYHNHEYSSLDPLMGDYQYDNEYSSVGALMGDYQYDNNYSSIGALMNDSQNSMNTACLSVHKRDGTPRADNIHFSFDTQRHMLKLESIPEHESGHCWETYSDASIEDDRRNQEHMKNEVERNSDFDSDSFSSVDFRPFDRSESSISQDGYDHPSTEQDSEDVSQPTRRTLIKPTQIKVHTLLTLMPIVIHNYPLMSRVGLCRALTGQLYSNSPQPSPNFIINTLIPVFLAAGALGFPWHSHLTNSLTYMKSWLLTQPTGREWLNRVRIEYHYTPSYTSRVSINGCRLTDVSTPDRDDYYSYCIKRPINHST